MNKESIKKDLEKVYVRTNGNVSQELTLLCALVGIPISKSSVEQKSPILYVRNGILLCGEDMLINSNNGFKFRDMGSKDWFLERIKVFTV